MVTRCFSSLDSINVVASNLNDKNRKKDVFVIAAENLKRINREKKEALADKTLKRNDKWKRNASAPGNLLSRRPKTESVKSASTQNLHLSLKDAVSKTPNSSHFKIPLDRSEPKGNRRRCMSSPNLPHQSSKFDSKSIQRSKSTISEGKSQMNQYVRDMFTKLEHCVYGSEWNNFCQRPSPEWMDFYTRKNGNALEAFICTNPNDQQSTCYLIDARADTRVARLLKYRENVRVGQNGVTKNLLYEQQSNQSGSIRGESLNTDILSKERIFPLSWTEQLEWKDAKVVTTNENRNDHYQAVSDVPCTYEIKSFSKAIGRREQEDRKRGKINGRTERRYKLKASDLTVTQNVQTNLKRTKDLREYCLQIDLPNVQPNLKGRSRLQYSHHSDSRLGGYKNDSRVHGYNNHHKQLSDMTYEKLKSLKVKENQSQIEYGTEKGQQSNKNEGEHLPISKDEATTAGNNNNISQNCSNASWEKSLLDNEINESCKAKADESKEKINNSKTRSNIATQINVKLSEEFDNSKRSDSSRTVVNMKKSSLKGKCSQGVVKQRKVFFFNANGNDASSNMVKGNACGREISHATNNDVTGTVTLENKKTEAISRQHSEVESGLNEEPGASSNEDLRKDIRETIRLETKQLQRELSSLKEKTLEA